MLGNAKLAGVRPELDRKHQDNESAGAHKVSRMHCAQKEKNPAS
jgi:hypothetical protein